jgi:DNA-directed RNA polymerase subunit RPC12/RpoP
MSIISKTLQEIHDEALVTAKSEAFEHGYCLGHADGLVDGALSRTILEAVELPPQMTVNPKAIRLMMDSSTTYACTKCGTTQSHPWLPEPRSSAGLALKCATCGVLTLHKRVP